jgi:hypothetical protein
LSIGTFDIEAKEWNNIYAIGYYINNEATIFKDKLKDNNSYIKVFLDAIPEGTYYAHNGARYDFLFILDFLCKNNINPSIIFIHNSPVKLSFIYDKKHIEFRDSLKILPHNLKKLTYSFNVEHKKLSLDYELGIDDKNFDEYFKNDLLGLYEVLMQCDLTDKLTIASNCMNIYTNKFYKNKYGKMTRNNNSIDKFFRGSYYGGRVELVKRYGLNLNYYDINSLYPFVMREFEYPLPIKNNYEYADKLYKDKLGIYYAKIKTPNINIPLLPYRLDKKLIFPIGTFEGIYTSKELIKAQALGYNIKIINGYTFKETDFIFKDYVEYYYNVKKNSEGAKREIAKLMLNSLYGKFGQKRLFNDIELINIKDFKKDIMYSNVVNDYILKSKESYNKYAQFLHSEIASLITSNARLYLYSFIEKCGFDNIYYYDTDSIITNKSLNTSNELGDMKQENEIKEFIGLGAKLYAYTNNKGEQVIHSKGFKDLSYSAFESAIEGDYSKINSKFCGLSSFKTSFVRHRTSFTTINTIERHINANYDKRVVKGNNTEPIIILK